MKARAPLVYIPTTGGFNLVAKAASKRDKVWDSGLVEGGVVANTPTTGVLEIGVSNRQGANRVFIATINYQDIAMLHIGVVESPIISVPKFLKGTKHPPRIRFVRVRL